MDLALLRKLFDRESRWQGPCTLILDAEATVQPVGPDSMGASATKSYAPRAVSGRVPADAVHLTADGMALVAVQQQKIRQATGEEVLKSLLTVADPARIIAVEFTDLAPLAALGITPPPLRAASHPGSNFRPAF